MPIKTKTFIRRAEREDLDTVVAWMEDADFVEFLYGDPARSPKQIRERIVAMLGRTAAQTVPGSVYLIIDSEDQGPIGLLSLQNISWRNRSCTLDAYLGNKKARNHLVGPIAFYRTIQYCFDELNLHRVTAYVYSFNRASWNILEKVGALRELTLKAHIARNGKLHDVYCYGLLRREFEAFREANPKLVAGIMESMVERESEEARKS